MKFKFLIKVFLFVLIAFVLMVNAFTHREHYNASDVQMVTCINYSGEYKIMKYTELEDIEEVLKGIRRIKFYKVFKSVHMQESPTSSITILYKNGKKKVISISGNIAKIYEGTKCYGYGVSMIDVKIFFDN